MIFLSVKKHNILSELGLVLIGSIILAISSQLNIPLKPVPITLQTIFVVFIGVIYGWRLGGYTVALYLLEGVSGLPVFAGFSCGFSVLFGPTGGYLLGFLLAAVIAGLLVEKGVGKSFFSAVLICIIAISVIYICGLTILSKFVGISNAYLYGVKPFLFVGIIKIIFLSLLVPKFVAKR